MLAYLRYVFVKMSFNATATIGTLTPSNATTVWGCAILTVLPILFKNVLLSSEAGKKNQYIPEIMQAPSQAGVNPEA